MNLKLFLLTLFGLASFALAANNTNITGIHVNTTYGSINESNFTCPSGWAKVKEDTSAGGSVIIEYIYGGYSRYFSGSLSDITCASGEVKLQDFNYIRGSGYPVLSYPTVICCRKRVTASNVTCPIGYVETKRYYPAATKAAYDDFGHWGVTDQNFTCNSSEKKLFNLDENSKNVNLCCKLNSTSNNTNNSNVSTVGDGMKLRCPTGYRQDVSVSLLTGAANNYTCPTGDRKLQSDNRDGSSDVICCKRGIISKRGYYDTKGATCNFKNAESCVSHNCNWYGDRKGFCSKNKYTCTLNN